MKTLICLIICLLSAYSYAQNEGNIWYFGEFAGMDFNGGSPVALTNGKINTKEGCAVICNPSGALLFYTDGMDVYDRNHNLMQNGSGLFGNPSATSSGVIIPRPGSSNLFYVFTVDAAENALANGLCYSIVDLNLNGGLGAVTAKNVLLAEFMTEKITAVTHCNGTDIWVITHKFDSDEFYIYKITTMGIMLPEIVQAIGVIHPDNEQYKFNALGQIKATTDGSRIALAIQGHSGTHRIQVFDFDNKTGVLSSPMTLTFTTHVYGLEFSRSNRYLYANHRYAGDVYQFDLQAGSQANIQASRVHLGTLTDMDTWDSYNAGALQMAPDGKIYIARHRSEYLAVINNPEAGGHACNLVENGFYLGGKKSLEGLPTFIQSYFYEPEISINDTCFGQPTNFVFANPNPKNDSIRWDFGDPASGTANFSNIYNPAHTYTAPGTYTVTIKVYICDQVQTFTRQVKIIEKPTISLGPDVYACSGNEVSFLVSCENCTYLWSSGSTESLYSTNNTETIWVKASNVCGWSSDTVNVYYFESPVVSLPPDTTFCETTSVTLDAGAGFTAYIWSTGQTSQTINISTSSQISVTVTDENNCKDSASTNTFAETQAWVDLGSNLEICQGSLHTFSPSTNCYTYLWHDGSTASIYTTGELETVSVTVSNTCGSASTSAAITLIKEMPRVDLGPDTMLCGKETIIIDAGNPGSTFLWSNGQKQQSIETGSGEKTIWVIVEKDGCAETDTIRILPCTQFAIGVPNAFTPNGDGENDILYVYGNNIVEMEFLVFNRFGQHLFTSTDQNFGWDGTYKGTMCEMDVYVWLLKVKFSDDDSRVYSGNVTLLR